MVLNAPFPPPVLWCIPIHVPVVSGTLVVGIVVTVITPGFDATFVVVGSVVSCSGGFVVGVAVVTVSCSGFMVVAVV